MRNHFPIYSLLHQEIKACATHLLELSQKEGLCPDKDAEHVLKRLLELHQFAIKVRSDEHYHPLIDLKHYLENTMLGFHDNHDRLQSIRLSEAMFLLGEIPEKQAQFNPSNVQSLTEDFLKHFLKDCKPGYSLFKKLSEIQTGL